MEPFVWKLIVKAMDGTTETLQLRATRQFAGANNYYLLSVSCWDGV